MPTYQNIKVEVVVDNQVLTEYPNPEPETRYAPTCYIEANPGQEYIIRVTFCKGFKTEGADCMCVTPTFDGDPTRTRGLYLTKDIPRLASKAGRLSQDVVLDIDAITAIDKQSGEWKRFAFYFKSLRTVEDGALPEGLTPDIMQQLGSIQLEVSRGKYGRTAYYSPDQYTLDLSNKDLDTVPEKILKGADLHATTKVAPKTTAPGTQIPCREILRLRRTAGQDQKFMIFYRSNSALQNLDLIPRDPGSLQCIGSEPEDEDKTQAQIDAYKAEIARLQAHLPRKIKIEDRKRPRAAHDTQDDDSEVEEIAPPAKKTAPVIELSDDEE